MASIVQLPAPQNFSTSIDSLSGKALVQFHQVAYLTHSIFIKYLIIPLSVTCSLIVLLPIDLIRHTIYSLGCQAHQNAPFLFHELASHIVTVALLPFRMIFYYFGNQGALFQLRDARYTKEALFISLLKLPVDASFVQNVLTENPTSNSNQARFNSTEKLLHHLIYNCGEVERAKSFLQIFKNCSTVEASGEVNAQLSALEIDPSFNREEAVQWAKNCLDLGISDWPLASALFHQFENDCPLFIEHCLIKANDPTVLPQTRLAYSEKAIDLLNRLSVGETTGEIFSHLLSCAIEQNQVEFVFNLAERRWNRNVDNAFFRHLEVFIAKMRQGTLQYEPIVKGLNPI